jgi:hypothetical protein
MNPLYNTGCHKSVHDLSEERKTEIFTQMEILIMDSLKENLVVRLQSFPSNLFFRSYNHLNLKFLTMRVCHPIRMRLHHNSVS